MPKSISMTETVPVSKACSLDTEVMDIDPEAESICGVRLGSLSQSEMDSRGKCDTMTSIATAERSHRIRAMVDDTRKVTAFRLSLLST